MKKNNIQTEHFAPDDIASWNYAQIWDKFPVPARPSKEELKFLKQEIMSIPNQQILILGSTIEYRTLCKRLGVVPYVADFERSHYEILTSYSKETFENEHFLEIDWLKIQDENKYDVILGHRAINVIGKEILQQFFERIYKALKPGGTFYCKGNILYNNGHDRLNELVDQWAFKKNREYPLFSYLEVDLYFHVADKDGYIDYPKAQKIIEKLLKDKRCTQQDYDLIKILVSMSEEARFRGLIHEKEINKIIKKNNFSENRWIVLDRDICQNMPIIKLKK